MANLDNKVLQALAVRPRQDCGFDERGPALNEGGDELFLFRDEYVDLRSFPVQKIRNFDLLADRGQAHRENAESVIVYLNLIRPNSTGQAPVLPNVELRTEEPVEEAFAFLVPRPKADVVARHDAPLARDPD